MVGYGGQHIPDYPGQQPWQDRAYQQFLMQQQQHQQQFQPAPQMQQQGQQQTKYVEVIPVDTVQEAEACPMAVGSSFLFFARDDSFIAVKSVGVNGQHSFSVFDKRPPAPVAPPFDPSAYVRRDEIGELVAAAVAAQNGNGKKGKKEAAEE